MITKFKIFEKKDRGQEILYTLKTKAISGKNIEYNVNIIQSDYNNDKLVLSIEGTPGSWYVETLLSGYSMTSNKLSISGYDWVIYNWDEVRKELIEILPDLEVIKNTKKYNL